ncbi:MAG TPA: deoxyribose-phosphate aldolase [Anaerolineaceae bacterium]|nr:deoxyribose-phosphate aldolase [Anaerolineaceae bacterium]
MVEQEEKIKSVTGETCVVEVSNGVKVKTCFDNAGHVVSAGAERLTSTIGVIPQDISLAGMIDHTLLKPDATPDKIAQLCFEARKYHFASVCVNPTHVKLCADLLRDSDVKVCTVIGFPLGATSAEVKAFEARNALDNGATEIDMVLNIGALKAGDNEVVAKDIRGVVETVHAAGSLVKVIIETALLTDEEKVIACLLAKEAGADYVKTSTGFSGGGATVHDIALMRKTVGPTIGVKASGGVHSREDAEALVAAGATRIGASAGVKIIQAGGADAKPPAAATAAPVSKAY